MRFRTLEIRWHDSKPISSCDFQPVHSKKARPTQEIDYATQAYRLATAGEDNHVRVRWSPAPPGATVDAGRQGVQVPSRVAHTALLLDLDGISKYHAPVRARGRVGALWGQHFAASTTRRVPLNPQSTFRCRERRPLLSKWSAFRFCTRPCNAH